MEEIKAIKLLKNTSRPELKEINIILNKVYLS